MGKNEITTGKSGLLSQALNVFNAKVEIETKLQDIKKENLYSAEQKILQIQHSSIIPQELRGKTAELIELEQMANTRGVPLLNLCNNIQFIDGRMGWKSTYIIACINKASNRFSAPLNYRSVGKDGEKSYGKRAYTYDINNNLVEGPVVTLEMAEKAGWTKKEKSYWNIIPEIMLTYRAATFFGRLYIPEILDGMLTADELVDIYSVSGSLPKEMLDQNVLDMLKESESVVITEAKAEVKAAVQESKPKVQVKSTLEAMLDDLEQNGWMPTNPTFHNGKFFVKIEPLTDVANTNVIAKWEFGKAKNGSIVKDVTSIMTEGEKDEYK